MKTDNLLTVIGANLRNKSALLELGCGSGALINAIAEKFKYLDTIVAVDFFNEPNTLSKKVKFVKQDLEDFHMTDHFDLIILNQVLEHIKDPLGLLATLKGNLNPHGRILVVVPNRHGFGNEARVYLPEHGKHYFLWDEESLEYSLNRIGFTCRFYNRYTAASHNILLRYMPALLRIQNPNLTCIAMVDGV